MNVRELKELLSQFPDDMPVVRCRDANAKVIRYDTLDGFVPERVDVVKREFMGQTYYLEAGSEAGVTAIII